jgi:hypothetical protein
MEDEVPLFYPGVFGKTLVVTLSIAIVGSAVALRVYGELALRDIIGSTITAALGAYLVHLWIALAKEQYGEDQIR